MKKILAFLFAVTILTVSVPSAQAARKKPVKERWVFIYEGFFMKNFPSAYSLVGYKKDLYLVDLGMMCDSLRSIRKESVLWVSTTDSLNGSDDTFVDPTRKVGKECKVQDAFLLKKWKKNLNPRQYDEFLAAVDNL